MNMSELGFVLLCICIADFVLLVHEARVVSRNQHAGFHFPLFRPSAQTSSQPLEVLGVLWSRRLSASFGAFLGGQVVFSEAGARFQLCWPCSGLDWSGKVFPGLWHGWTMRCDPVCRVGAGVSKGEDEALLRQAILCAGAAIALPKSGSQTRAPHQAWHACFVSRSDLQKEGLGFTGFIGFTGVPQILSESGFEKELRLRPGAQSPSAPSTSKKPPQILRACGRSSNAERAGA